MSNKEKENEGERRESWKELREGIEKLSKIMDRQIKEWSARRLVNEEIKEVAEKEAEEEEEEKREKRKERKENGEGWRKERRIRDGEGRGEEGRGRGANETKRSA